MYHERRRTTDQVSGLDHAELIALAMAFSATTGPAGKPFNRPFPVGPS